MRKRKGLGDKYAPVFVAISIILAIVLAGLLYYSRVQDKKRVAELSVIVQQERDKQTAQKEAEQQAELELQMKKENNSFYQKLADGFDVNVLIVGDSIGAGAGASDNDHSWPSLLKNNLESTYDILVTLTNVSMGGNTSYAGYARTMALDDGVDYDLVVLCYGQNDKEDNFSLYYEAMIRAVKNRYPKASLLAILESSQKDYTLKMQAIQAMADHYGIPVVDTIAPFQSDYDSLVKDSVHPNDAGHAIYCDTTMATINSLVAEFHGFDPTDVAIVKDQVTSFDSFRWLGVGQFTRDGNTFTLNTSATGIILGIDYTFTFGNNSCQILIDGEEYSAPEITFDYDSSQRHIMIVNDWLNDNTINIQNEIKIVFSDDENGTAQADGFYGLIIAGE